MSEFQAQCEIYRALKYWEMVSKLVEIWKWLRKVFKISFYTTAFKGCVGIVFPHSFQIGDQAGCQVGRWVVRKSLSGMYLRNHKVLEVETWLEHWLWV